MRTRLALLLLGLTFAAACSSSGADDGKLDVVAAFYPLAEAARQVGGDAVTVHDLTPAGVEPHDLELKPSDLGRIRSADLILYLGGGFQPALEDAIAALPDRSDVLDLLRGGPALREVGAGDPVDPHVWLDPQRFLDIVERVAARLGPLLPDRRAELTLRADDYAAMLTKLDGDMERTLITCKRKEFVTTHAAFGYLASRYNLEQIPISGVEPEADPSPRRLEDVARIAEDRAVTTIYFETLVSPRVAEAIARTVGAKTAVLNPIEGLTDEQARAGENYVSLMRANLAALVEGLGCEPS